VDPTKDMIWKTSGGNDGSLGRTYVICQWQSVGEEALSSPVSIECNSDEWNVDARKEHEVRFGRNFWGLVRMMVSRG